MQLKIKWVEINKSSHASPDVTLVARPLTGACDVMLMMIGKSEAKGWQALPAIQYRYITKIGKFTIYLFQTTQKRSKSPSKPK
jgi:hypothetical protein